MSALQAELPSGADVRAVAERLIGDELVVVPVRHHSPAGSRAVRQAFQEHRPSRVLIEGPPALTGLVEHLVHPDARFPLAGYVWCRRQQAEDQRVDSVGAYYPFCDHSPELVALQLASTAGVPAAFCDLPLGDLVDLGVQGLQGGSLLAEPELSYNVTLQDLASRMGCRDPEDLWELFFEADRVSPTLQEYVARMTAFSLLLRATTPPEQLAADGVVAREGAMAAAVREAVAARSTGEGPVLLVTGGLHAVVIPALLADLVPDPGTHRASPGDEVALIRYDFQRLDRLHGYAAGMTSPGWHQRTWQEQEQGLSPVAAREAAALTTLHDVAERLRVRRPGSVPTPTITAALQQAVLLARLRQRPAPLRSDVLDAITSCFVTGDLDVEGAPVLAAAAAVLTGDAAGTLPPGSGTPPLVLDVLQRLRDHGLDPERPAPRLLSLDIHRSARHRSTSRILHGLRLLGVPFADHVAGPDFVAGTGLTRLQERWRCHWTTDCEAALAEASRFGSTLPEAVANAFDESTAALTAAGRMPTSLQATSLLAHAAVLGLHRRAAGCVRLVRRAVAHEPDFVVAAASTAHLALLVEGREPLEGRLLTGLPELLAQAYGRATFLGLGLPDAGTEQELVAPALQQLRSVAGRPVGAALDPELLWDVVDRLRTEHPAALVRGAATGLAYSAGRVSAVDVGRAAAGHLTGTLPATDGVGFIRGLLSTARETLWQDTGTLEAVDARLRAWDDPAFLEHLPDLRLAFADLTPRETDRVARRVSVLHGSEELPPLVSDQDEHEVLRMLQVSVAATRLLADDGLGDWTS